ncbi:hypothetical protein [Desulfobacula toluolica]|uniref:Uncharacterized protein n=1 Tax=Desulfobacula toluolica (strain DSM 7467 / Tol2) TaxID=651182 RepID=K0NIH0_DESTT|nr:hypothetical protein [Desulfobacula toluolica]CCK81201.1 uncharacterized protein TOL2_C30420 [Desulfobacula toluolica Tol2]
MLEIHLDERGELAIENISALLKAFPQYAERATASALKSEGYRLKGLIQEAIRGGGVDGGWDELNPHTGVLARAKRGSVKNYRMVWKGRKGSKKRVRQYKEVMLSKKKAPLSKLAGAVRYEYDEDMQMVNIGFMQSAGVSDSMVRLARMHAKGYETRITPRMRKMLFALGFPVKKSTTTLKTPARPVIEPIFEQEKDNIMGNIERKFFRSLNRYLSGRAVKKESDLNVLTKEYH